VRKICFLSVVGALMATVALTASAEPDVPSIQKKNSEKKSNFWNDVVELDRQKDSLNPVMPPTDEQIEVKIHGNNLAPDRAFFDELTTILRNQSDFRSFKNFVAEDHTVGRIDLNGDGTNELIVSSTEEGWCGTARECTVFVYYYVDKKWRYVGNITSIYGFTAYFEKKRHHGWRVFNYVKKVSGEITDGYPDGITEISWSKCWTTPDEIRAYYKKNNLTFTDDGPIKASDYELGRIIDPNIGGYLNLSGKEPCWKK